jgi:hypothetical protein
MIYAPILEHPIFELDQYIDLESLLHLEKLTAMLLSKHKSSFSVASSGPSTPGLRTWLDETVYKEVKNSLIECVIPDEHKATWDLLTHDQQLHYALMTNKGRSLNYGLAIRFISNSPGGNSGKFHLKHLEKFTQDTTFRKDFEFIFDWLKKENIFKEIGRVQFFINPEGNCTPIHRDYAEKSLKDQFIWIRFNKQKDFFVYDEDQNQKHFVQGHVCVFDNHQWHGSEPNEFMGFSLRVDGVFSTEFLEKTNLINHFKN